MGATTVTGKGLGDSHKRIAYLSRDLPKYSFTKTTSNPQDFITGVPDGGGGGNLPPCDPPGGDPRGFQAVDLQCCRFDDSQVASGNYSFIAAGCANTASGIFSHAEGYYNTASGYASHAEGHESTASGYVSHVAGRDNEASGNFSTIGGGRGNTAEQPYTVVGGGYNNHAEADFATIGGGRDNDADTEGSVIAGGGDNYVGGGGVSNIYNTISGGLDNGISNSGYSSIGGGRSNHIGDTDFGTITGGRDNSTFSNGATCCGGRGNYADGYGAHAEGYFTQAISVGAHAEGQSTLAFGRGSHAEGYSTYSGYKAHAEGNYTTASGTASHAEGHNTNASGNHSHAEGYYTYAAGYASHAEGSYATANGYASHAGGVQSVATHTGQWARASGTFSSYYEPGSSQITTATHFVSTSNDTPTRMPIDGTSEFFEITDGKGYLCWLYVIGKRGNELHCTTRYFTIWRDGATTTLIGLQTIGIDIDTGTTWVVTVSADDTTDTLDITVTGDNGSDINWMARLETTEVVRYVPPG